MLELIRILHCELKRSFSKVELTLRQQANIRCELSFIYLVRLARNRYMIIGKTRRETEYIVHYSLRAMVKDDGSFNDYARFD